MGNRKSYIRVGVSGVTLQWETGRVTYIRVGVSGVTLQWGTGRVTLEWVLVELHYSGERGVDVVDTDIQQTFSVSLNWGFCGCLPSV